MSLRAESLMNNCYTTCLSKSMQEHPGLQVPLRSATGSNRFQIGEVIRLEVILSSNTPNRYLEPSALFRESNFGCTATLLGHRPPRPSRPSPWPPATRTAQWPRLPTRSNSLTTSELAIAGPGTTPRPSAVLGLSGDCRNGQQGNSSRTAKCFSNSNHLQVGLGAGRFRRPASSAFCDQGAAFLCV